MKRSLTLGVCATAAALSFTGMADAKHTKKHTAKIKPKTSTALKLDTRGYINPAMPGFYNPEIMASLIAFGDYISKRTDDPAYGISMRSLGNYIKPANDKTRDTSLRSVIYAACFYVVLLDQIKSETPFSYGAALLRAIPLGQTRHLNEANNFAEQIIRIGHVQKCTTAQVITMPIHAPKGPKR